MCLQWCHQRKWLIDNDMPCHGCPLADPPAGVCDRCRHRRAGESGESCALTRMPLPRIRGCCHAEAEIADLGDLTPLAAVQAAPWTLEHFGASSPAALVLAHPSQPAIVIGPDGCAALRLRDLATPLVYGVPSGAWESALSPAAHGNEVTPSLPPSMATLALQALEAVQRNESAGAALAALEEALNRHRHALSAEGMAWLHRIRALGQSWERSQSKE